MDALPLTRTESGASGVLQITLELNADRLDVTDLLRLFIHPEPQPMQVEVAPGTLLLRSEHSRRPQRFSLRKAEIVVGATCLRISRPGESEFVLGWENSTREGLDAMAELLRSAVKDAGLGSSALPLVVDQSGARGVLRFTKPGRQVPSVATAMSLVLLLFALFCIYQIGHLTPIDASVFWILLIGCIVAWPFTAKSLIAWVRLSPSLVQHVSFTAAGFSLRVEPSGAADVISLSGMRAYPDPHGVILIHPDRDDILLQWDGATLAGIGALIDIVDAARSLASARGDALDVPEPFQDR